MSFFLDIFNKLLKINEDSIMIIFDVESNIWFKFKDVLKALEYSSIDKIIFNFKINKLYIKKFIQLKVLPTWEGPSNFQKSTYFINESGLYQLLSLSTKPLAKLFMNKYFKDIMPEIRKTGKYILDENNKQKLDIMNKKLEKIEKDNVDLLNNQRNIIYPDGKALYVIILMKNNKKYFKIGYTKNLNKRLKTYNTSFPYKIFFDYYILVDDEKIDKCIKKIMKNEEFIKNKEYYKTSLNKILNFIKDCDDSLDEICCGYCLKCYKFNKIKIHKCKYISVNI